MSSGFLFHWNRITVTVRPQNHKVGFCQHCFKDSKRLLPKGKYFVDESLDKMKTHLMETYLSFFLGAGKTTLLRRVCEQYLQQTERISCYGFYTEEVRGTSGSRIGFDVVTLDGKSRSPLARTDEFTSLALSPSSLMPRVGQYNVFLQNFETMISSLLTNVETPCLCFIDEIGKMELFSRTFQQLIQTLLNRPNLIFIATIPIKPLKFVDALRARKDYRLFTVTYANRSGSVLYNEVIDCIEQLLQTQT